MQNDGGHDGRWPRDEPPIEGGATPWWLANVLRSAAGAVTGTALAGVPDAEPRRPPSGTRGDYSSALALRMAGAVGLTAQELAADIAAELRSSPHVVRATNEGRGFISVTLTPRARVSLVRSACDGSYLMGWRFRGEDRSVCREERTPSAWSRSSRHGSLTQARGGDTEMGLGVRAVATWGLTSLHEAGSVDQARDWAREDARRRMALAMGIGGGAGDGSEWADTAELGPFPAPPVAFGRAENSGPDGEVPWRDPYLDGSPGDGDAARLLAAVGEANARFAFCRSVSERPRVGEVTGPGLPALPTAEVPGNWYRLTAENPGFMVRHAHAHAVSTRSWAVDAGVVPPEAEVGGGGEWGREFADDGIAALNEPSAAALVGCLFDGPGVLWASAGRRQPHILVRYLEGVATAYHDWRESCTAVPGMVASDAQREEVGMARLTLCAAVAGVLRTGLCLLGVPAPTRL